MSRYVKVSISALYRNDEQSAMAIARSLEECVDDVAQENYCALFESLVNEHMRRKIIRTIAKSDRFREWLFDNSMIAFRALHQSRSLNVMLDVFNKSWRPSLMIQSGKLIISLGFHRSIFLFSTIIMASHRGFLRSCCLPYTGWEHATPPLPPSPCVVSPSPSSSLKQHSSSLCKEGSS